MACIENPFQKKYEKKKKTHARTHEKSIHDTLFLFCFFFSLFAQMCKKLVNFTPRSSILLHQFPKKILNVNNMCFTVLTANTLQQKQKNKTHKQKRFNVAQITQQIN